MDRNIQPIHGIERTSTSEAEHAVTALLRLVGEDPHRDGLRETGERSEPCTASSSGN
jgi:GTP cyclohydrolase I